MLDDFSTGGLGSGTNGSVDEFAGWGSRAFKQITWRKIQLVQDILLQASREKFTACGCSFHTVPEGVKVAPTDRLPEEL